MLPLICGSSGIVGKNDIRSVGSGEEEREEEEEEPLAFCSGSVATITQFEDTSRGEGTRSIGSGILFALLVSFELDEKEVI